MTDKEVNQQVDQTSAPTEQQNDELSSEEFDAVSGGAPQTAEDKKRAAALKAFEQALNEVGQQG